MLTKLTIRNFKQFSEVHIELGQTVVFVGPNNSGKTTALQALSLWKFGIKQWNNKKKSSATTKGKRTGIVINRNEIITSPIPSSVQFWRDLHTRVGKRNQNNKSITENIRIDIVVCGITNGEKWECGLEFDYANSEFMYCRPIGDYNLSSDIIEQLNISFLPPMSGLTAQEPKWDQGRINVLIGEGQTAQVLRNLCYNLTEENFNKVNNHIKSFFGLILNAPKFDPARGELTMSYKNERGAELDLSCGGRGFQQTVLLLAHLYNNPKCVLLLDEPDAHLEVLRQRQMYSLLTNIAKEQGSQIICASHSEVVLNEAAAQDTVIAFTGKPHLLNVNQKSQLRQSLAEIGWEHYSLAEQKGWVLFLEGTTDLAILKVFAKILGHESEQFLQNPYLHTVGNSVAESKKHFSALHEAYPKLAAIAIFDRFEPQYNLQTDPRFEITCWKKREIENYFCTENILMKYADGKNDNRDLFSLAQKNDKIKAMRTSIDEMTQALTTLGKNPWSDDIKATDEFLDRLFENYFNKLSQPCTFTKGSYHELASLVSKEDIDPEIIEKLDAIVKIAKSAVPYGENLLGNE